MHHNRLHSVPSFFLSVTFAPGERAGVTHETRFPHERSGSEQRPMLWGAKAYSGALKMLNTMLCDQCHRSNQGLFLPPLVGHEPGGPRGSEQIVRSTTCFHPTKFPDLFIPPSSNRSGVRMFQV